MRTTLKRGIGRGAEVNGNGHGVIPPGTLSPVTLYRQPPQQKPGLAKVIGRFFLGLFVVLLMLVAGLVGGFYLWASTPRELRARPLLDQAERHGASFLFGEAFFANSGGDHHFRLALTAVPRADRVDN